MPRRRDSGAGARRGSAKRASESILYGTGEILMAAQSSPGTLCSVGGYLRSSDRVRLVLRAGRSLYTTHAAYARRDNSLRPCRGQLASAVLGLSVQGTAPPVSSVK